MVRPLSRRPAAWLLAPLPAGRVAALRRVTAAFVILDVLVTSSWAAAHRNVPLGLYRPLAVARLLPVPLPSPGLMAATGLVVLVAAATLVAGRAWRAAGAALFASYGLWMVWAMSYGKVDHDRFALLVALGVLPTAGAASLGDRRRSAAAGWAVRSVQLAVVATYLLAAVAKLRIGGWGWANGATFAWALARRATPLGEPLLEHPALLVAAQWALLVLELAAPALLLLGRRGRIALAVAFAFHAVTFAAIGISFLPHLVCLLAFLPLERLPPRRRRAGARPSARPDARSPSPT